MPAQAFALLAAVGFATSSVAAKRGLQTASVPAGVLIDLTAGTLMLAALVAIDRPGAVEMPGALVFVAAGLVAPGMSRWASTTGFARLGPTIAVPILAGMRPVLSAIGAILFLGEAVRARRVAGLALVIAGGWFLSRAPAQRDGPAVFRPAVAWPVLAALCFATSDVIVKQILDSVPTPTVGALLAACGALLFWGFTAAVAPPVRRSLRFGSQAPWMVLSGALVGLAIASLFTALDGGEVTVVIPILASQPLLVVGLSWLLLRRIEILTPVKVAGAAAVVAGTILVSVG
jgi:drug/metabolite transporter (DMT)-like permease